MPSEPDLEEYELHSCAVIAARLLVGLEPVPHDAGDQWWSGGPHIEKDGRCYYVHAIGCLRWDLDQAIRNHPDWYVVLAVVHGTDVQLRGIGGDVITLNDLREMREALSPDEMRLAIEFTSAEVRRLWGTSAPNMRRPS